VESPASPRFAFAESYHVYGVAMSESVNILFVDDDPDIRFVMKLILQKEGFNVFFAENGTQALDVWQNLPVDLILLDVVMPSLDGFEFCASLDLSTFPSSFLLHWKLRKTC
jgi:CheY-like chemotaxis protein